MAFFQNVYTFMWLLYNILNNHNDNNIFYQIQKLHWSFGLLILPIIHNLKTILWRSIIIPDNCDIL